MGFIARLMGRRDETALPLYNAIVARAREPHWYEAGVPDTVDGRFDMIATILAFVLLRLEDDPAAAEASARLTERYEVGRDGTLSCTRSLTDPTVGKLLIKSIYRRT